MAALSFFLAKLNNEVMINIYNFMISNYLYLLVFILIGVVTLFINPTINY